jgi:sterol-4alpha-carboxylate 3-dehydrogenase (decarboxylating)
MSEADAPPTVLVTGACGMTGRAIVDMLLRRGERVRSLDLEPHPDPRVASIVGDVRDPTAAAAACAGVRTVHHTVAVVSQHPGKAALLDDVNVGGTRVMLRAAQAAGVERFVYTSSIDVVFSGAAIAGGDESLPYAERHLDDYGRSKADAERLVLAANGHAGMATIALRAAGIFGPGDRHRLPVVLRVVRGRRYLPLGPGTARFSHVYVDNVAHAHVLSGAQLALSHPAAGRAYFVTDHQPTNFFRFVEEYFLALGSDFRRPRLYVPFSVAWPLGAIVEVFYRLFGGWLPGDPVMTRYTAAAVCRDFWFVHVAARRDLGYEPIVTAEEAFARTLAWLRDVRD